MMREGFAGYDFRGGERMEGAGGVGDCSRIVKVVFPR